MASKKAVAKKEDTTDVAVIDSTIPAYMQTGSARGSEDVRTDDKLVPRIDVLQALSPQIQKSKPKYIEDAEIGMLFNTANNRLYGNELLFIPVMFRSEYIAWRDRKSGGGLIAVATNELDAARELKNSGEKGEVVLTHNQHSLLIHGDHNDEEVSFEDAVFSMSKSKIKVSRRLNSLIDLSDMDRFSNVYRLTTVEEQKNGETYWTYKIARVGWCPEHLFHVAEKKYLKMKKEGVKIDYSSGDGASEDGEGVDPGEDPPF